MPSSRKFKVFLEGRNVLADLGGERRRYGFYTTRFVEALREAEASHLAQRSVVEEFAAIIQNEPADPPTITVEEVTELASFDGLPVPGTGASWFPEEDE